jgi:transposase
VAFYCRAGLKLGLVYGCAAGSVAAQAVSSIRSHAFHAEGEASLMISPEIRAQIRRYFYAEHWKIGTIARELGVHPDAVRNAIDAQRLGGKVQPLRASLIDPYAEFIRQTLDQHPRLLATRIYQMVRDRGYTGSVVQLRRAVSRIRPQVREPFLRLSTLPGEQGQVDWAHFGHVMVGRARRALSCFVITLSYSRALYLEFFFDQTTENFLRGHVHAFQAWNGQPRAILYDNLKSAVLERRGTHILFNPRLVELSAHYHFSTQPCARRQSKGACGTCHSICARFLLGRPDFHHIGRMQSSGLAVARSSGSPTPLAWRGRSHGR